MRQSVIDVVISGDTNVKIHRIPELIQDFWNLLKMDFDSSFSIILCDRTQIKSLNREFRDNNKITDVLSFPTDVNEFLGDIFICIDQVVKQAEDTKEKEMEKVLCHSLLHLLGYKDDTENEIYREMMQIQTYLLQHKKVSIRWE